MRREKRELERPRIVQNLGQGYPILRRTRTDFFKPPQAIVALAPKAGSLGEHRVAVAAEPLRAWGSSVVRCQKNAHCGSGRAYGAPHQSASGGEGGSLCEG